MNVRHLLDWLPWGAVPEIHPSELARELERGSVQLVDVRTQAEFDTGHIASARHAPITEFARAIDALSLDAQQRVVAICESGRRSIPAVRVLTRRGFVDVVQLAGGMRSWRAAGFSVLS